jgi:hypothetical protein
MLAVGERWEATDMGTADGFAESFYGRPESFLKPAVRRHGE